MVGLFFGKSLISASLDFFLLDYSDFPEETIKLSCLKGKDLAADILGNE